MSTPNVLTVIVRDDSPMIHANASPTYRTIRIYLSDGQRLMLSKEKSEHPSGLDELEHIDRAILEYIDPRDL